MMWDVRATAKGPSHTLRGHTDRVTGLLASGGSVYSCSEVGSGCGLSVSFLVLPAEVLLCVLSVRAFHVLSQLRCVFV